MTVMTVNEILRHKFEMDFEKVLLHHGPSGVEAVLRSELYKAAEEAFHLGTPCGGNEVDLSHLAHYMGLLSVALRGRGNEEVED